MLDDNVGLAYYQCRRVLGERYHRLDPMLSEQISLDGVDQISLLRELAVQVDLSATVVWLAQYF